MRSLVSSIIQIRFGFEQTLLDLRLSKSSSLPNLPVPPSEVASSTSNCNRSDNDESYGPTWKLVVRVRWNRSIIVNLNCDGQIDLRVVVVSSKLDILSFLDSRLGLNMETLAQCNFTDELASCIDHNKSNVAERICFVTPEGEVEVVGDRSKVVENDGTEHVTCFDRTCAELF